MEVEKIKTLPITQTLLKAIKDMVFIVRVEQNSVFEYTFFNEAVFQKTHLTEEDIGRTFVEVHNPELANLLTLYYQQAFLSKQEVSFTDSYLSFAGIPRHSLSTLTPLLDEEGDCTHIVGIVKDITEEILLKKDHDEAWQRLKNSQSRYRSLYENNADAIFSLDTNGNILSGNESVRFITGYLVDELIGTPLSSHLNEKDSELLSHHFQLALSRVSQKFRTKFRGNKGQLIGISMHLVPAVVESQVVGIYAIVKDMREIDRLISQYTESENRFRIIAENAHDVIVLMDFRGEILYVSPSVNHVYGFDSEEYTQKSPFHNVHSDDLILVRDVYLQAVHEAKNFVLEIRMKHKTKGWIWSQLQGTPIFDEEEEFIHMLTISRDITLQKEHEAQLHYYAFHDSLTGLPNRRYFKKCLTEQLALLEETNEKLAVVLMDIDHFKEINDQFGHEIGDAVIEEFGKRIVLPLGNQDVAARLGGDEFVILLPNITTQLQAEKLVADIRSLFDRPWTILEHTLPIQASIGMVIVPAKEVTASSILKSADLAMYEAKSDGRSTYRLHIQ